jgi:exodeoxyribonuclease V alpha subunit
MSLFDLEDEAVAPPRTEVNQPGASITFGQNKLIAGDRASVVGRLNTVKVLANGWGFGFINDEKDKSLSVTGNPLAGLNRGTTYEFSGMVVQNGKFGLQLKIDSAGIHIPASSEGLISFLKKNFKGLGAKSAQRIVDFYAQTNRLQDFRARLLVDPYGFDFSETGIKRKFDMKAKDGLMGVIYMEIATRLGGVDIGDKLLRKLAEYLESMVKENPRPVEKAWSLITTNPYAPIRDLSGYSFKTADALARRIAFDMQSKVRVAALATYAIAEGCGQGGHTYLTLENLKRIIHAIDESVDVLAAIEAAVEMQEPIVIEDGKFYTTQVLEAEMSLAKKFAWREGRQIKSAIYSGSTESLMQDMADADQSIGFSLDQTQLKAVQGVLTSRSNIHSITAGPGCGKTTIMEFVVEILRHKKKTIHIDGEYQQVPFKIDFCAPTGKAAKVLNSRLTRFGLSAKTIHSLLGVKGEGPGNFVHNRNNKLDVDLLVVDEASMVDLVLLNSLVDALPPACHIVFLGDDKQLPSVGPGSCLKDILLLPFDHHLLSVTHRNDGGILEVINLAGRGLVDFQQRSDVSFIERLPEPTPEGIGEVLAMYDGALLESGGDFNQVGLLCARRKGDIETPGWNVTYLNARLRERYNPEISGGPIAGYSTHTRKAEVMRAHGLVGAPDGEKIFGTKYRVKDRVIIRKNMVLKEDDEEDGDQVVNGDTGVIVDYQMGDGELRRLLLGLDDGRTVLFPAGEADVLDFSYAMTVHAAQGSEYRHILFVCVNGASSFVHRGIVFTALSRAKKRLTVIGDRDVVKQVASRAAPSRNSFLVQRYAIECKK